LPELAEVPMREVLQMFVDVDLHRKYVQMGVIDAASTFLRRTHGTVFEDQRRTSIHAGEFLHDAGGNEFQVFESLCGEVCKGQLMVVGEY